MKKISPLSVVVRNQVASNGRDVITTIDVRLMGVTVAVKTVFGRWTQVQALREWQINKGSFKLGDPCDAMRVAETVVLGDGLGDQIALHVAEWVVTQVDKVIALAS